MTLSKERYSILTNKNVRYKRLSTEEKRILLKEAEEPGKSISLVARKYGLGASTLFEWRNKMKKGALAGLSTKEDLVPASKLKALQIKIKNLERIVGKKTVEVEILKEAVEIGREKKLISHSPLQGVEDFHSHDRKNLRSITLSSKQKD